MSATAHPAPALSGSPSRAPRAARARGSALQVAAVAVIALVLVSPLFLLFVASLKPDRFQILQDMGSFRAFWVPNPTGKNFGEVLTFSGPLPFARYLVNSLFILAVTVGCGVFVNSAAAFVLAWGRLPGLWLVLGLLIALYIVPQESIVLPLLMMVNRVGMTDTFTAQILPWMASPLFIFLFYQFFKQVPKDMVDAARMDGAGPWRIYWSLFLPLSLPVMATVAILLGIDTWNQYLWPLMVTQTSYARPISVGIASFFGADSIFWNDAMAASVIMMLPVLALYLAFQRWFVASVMGAAVK